MKDRLKDKVAIITGASSGIGNATAKALFDAGVICYDISLVLSQNDFIKKGYACDVNNYERMGEIIDEIYAIEGHIDIFINNAGYGIAGAIEYSKPENIYKQIDTNLSSYIALSGIVMKYLKLSRGRLINISSVGGIIPLPYQATYSATKAGVEIFSRALANEVKEYGVKVTAILPGDTKTGFTAARVIDNEVNDKFQKDSIRKSIAKMEKDEEKGMSPSKIAKLIVKVLKRKHPPLRVTGGGIFKLVVFLPRIVSTKFVNRVVRKLYCKKAR